MENWLIAIVVAIVAIGAVLLFSWALVSVISDIVRARSRQRLLESVGRSFDRGALNAERLKVLADAEALAHSDLKLVMTRLHAAVIRGDTARNDAIAMQEIESLVKELEAVDPFQGFPSDLRAPLEQLAAALGPKRTALDNLLAHLKEYSISSIKEKRRAYFIGIGGAVMSATGLALRIWWG